MSEFPFRTAAVIGTGMMGPGIGLTLARGGLRVIMVSRSSEGAQQGLAKAQHQAAVLRENHLLPAEQADRLVSHLSATADFDTAIAAADFVVESGPETMEWKQDIFARMDGLAKPGAVLASNTSGLSITEIASRCGRPQRVLTTHFWNPPHLMPLVEVVLGEKTDRQLAQTVKDFLAHCGKRPVLVKKDTPGQLGNRLQMALVREAIHIVEAGIADVEDVDLAAKIGFGLRLPVYGILEHQDMVGLDLGIKVLEYAAQDLYSERRAPQLVRDKVAKGELGVKTGRGFYDWSTRDPEAVKARRDQFVLEYLQKYGSGPT
jgi:3-hydroxybutyryl-CoA dehydrogenase